MQNYELAANGSKTYCEEVRQVAAALSEDTFHISSRTTCAFCFGVQRIHDIDGQVVVKQKTKNVVTVMSGSLKSCFYFVWLFGTVSNRLKQLLESIYVVGDGICKAGRSLLRERPAVFMLRWVRRSEPPALSATPHIHAGLLRC